MQPSDNLVFFQYDVPITAYLRFVPTYTWQTHSLGPEYESRFDQASGPRSYRAAESKQSQMRDLTRNVL